MLRRSFLAALAAAVVAPHVLAAEPDYLVGDVQCVRVFDRALTGDEIRVVMLETAPLVRR